MGRGKGGLLGGGENQSSNALVGDLPSPPRPRAEQPLGGEQHAMPPSLTNLATLTAFPGPSVPLLFFFFFLVFGCYHRGKKIYSLSRQTALGKVVLEGAQSRPYLGLSQRQQLFLVLGL